MYVTFFIFVILTVRSAVSDGGSLSCFECYKKNSTGICRKVHCVDQFRGGCFNTTFRQQFSFYEVTGCGSERQCENPMQVFCNVTGKTECYAHCGGHLIKPPIWILLLLLGSAFVLFGRIL